MAGQLFWLQVVRYHALSIPESDSGRIIPVKLFDPWLDGHCHRCPRPLPLRVRIEVVLVNWLEGWDEGRAARAAD